MAATAFVILEGLKVTAAEAALIMAPVRINHAGTLGHNGEGETHQSFGSGSCNEGSRGNPSSEHCRSSWTRPAKRTGLQQLRSCTAELRTRPLWLQLLPWHYGRTSLKLPRWSVQKLSSLKTWRTHLLSGRLKLDLTRKRSLT
jgi:hypothetical protein